MNENSIQVKNLTKKFGDFVAVNNISFEILKGEIFGFLGPNGAGKSTTIRMLCGILEPTLGEGNVSGFDLIGQSEQIKRHIGYMSQRFSLYEDLTVLENLEFYGGIYGVPRESFEGRRKEVLKLVGLSDIENMMTSLITGGWRQRLSLACALLHSPKIVFLDEPTSGVDPISRRDFWEIINYLSGNGITVIVTTHYLEEAEYCHKLVLINHGKIIAKGTPYELKSLFEDRILEVSTPKIFELMQIIDKDAMFGDVSLWGSALHVVLKQGDKSLEYLRTKALENNILIENERPVLPTLEDIFIKLVGTV